VEDFVPADAVVHRVVHGGARFRRPVLIDADVERAVEDVTALAPLHNRPALDALRAARCALPDAPHVAVFDTAFHATIPEAAAAYAVPRRWREDLGIRRYGFHGLSVQWVAEHVPAARVVVCHLGGGCSVTAVRDGRSVDTTMGFSPLEGVPMTTRSGSVDPGALLHLLGARGVEADALEHALNFDSGLKGLAGREGGMREIEAAARAGDPDAAFAIDVFVYRVGQSVAAMAAAAGGIDALVFTAGIGEGSALVRERVAAQVHFLRVEIDPSRNAEAKPDSDVASRDSPVRVFVVRAREELIAARAARALLRA
jgi:acetate kinase